jgi:DivIVA domain-containing protein
MRKKDRTDEAHDFSGLPVASAISAADIQAKEFGVSRFGGYRMRDVDEFLDELTSSVAKLTEENERLRSGAGLPAAPIGAPDLADTSRQADEIIERARAEAARIVGEAQAGAATSPPAGASGPAGDPERAAVSQFLAGEREFLQSLATLVQGHAEAIKQMARASRPTAKPTTPASAASAAPAASAAASTAASTGTTAPERADETSELPKRPPADEPVRIEDPEPASVARGDADAEEGEAGPGSDRSLRDLFWGED